jgi:hypothetical protein
MLPSKHHHHHSQSMAWSNGRRLLWPLTLFFLHVLIAHDEYNGSNSRCWPFRNTFGFIIDYLWEFLSSDILVYWKFGLPEGCSIANIGDENVTIQTSPPPQSKYGLVQWPSSIVEYNGSNSRCWPFRNTFGFIIDYLWEFLSSDILVYLFFFLYFVLLTLSWMWFVSACDLSNCRLGNDSLPEQVNTVLRKKSVYPEIVVNITLLISLTQESESLTFTPWKTYMMDSSRNVKTWILSKRGTVSSVLKTQLITYELHNCTRWTWLLIQTDIYWELWLLTYMTACWHNY